MIKEITLTNLLSFGPEGMKLEMRPLNILIGANGSGKSNFIDALTLFQAAPQDIRVAIKKVGGINSWIWSGSVSLFSEASARCVIDYRRGAGPISHEITLAEGDNFSVMVEEIIEYSPKKSNPQRVWQYISEPGGLTLSRGDKDSEILLPKFDITLSVLSQFKEPAEHHVLYFLCNLYQRFLFYTQWSFGRQAAFRQPQRADQLNDKLSEDAMNLGLILNKSMLNAESKKAILEGLQQLYSDITDYLTFVQGGYIQIFVKEAGITIPATRLSDGTLRYLCLLAILCDPEPPPLICIEEPELGLHPDLMPTIARLLRDAATRTQLVVTTHSDILVDAFTEDPECVVVCEKEDGQTRMRRLDEEKLKVWLEKYRLGDLWTSGEIGGVRW